MLDHETHEPVGRLVAREAELLESGIVPPQDLSGGDLIRLFWDPVLCGGSTDYNLIVGNLSEVSDYTLQSGVCAIGSLGAYNWSGVPAGDLYFLVVGVHECPIYESSWGTDSLGGERNGTLASNLCGVTTKILAANCQ